MSTPAASPMSPREYLRVLAIAALLGPPVAILSAGLMAAIHGVTTLAWTDIPDAAGWSSPPAWYVLVVPVVGGAIVALALRMPGHGGHSAVGDLSMEPLSPLGLVSALLAALASLGLGLVLGPEAPLLALGLTAGLVAGKALRAEESAAKLIVMAGAFASISTVFGGPLPSALLLFELAAAHAVVPAAALGRTLVPGFLASGTAALMFTGVDDWPGVKETVLSLPALPDYPTVQGVDVAWAVPVALMAGLIVAGARSGARRASERTTLPPALLLCGGGLAVGALAVAFREITSQPVDLVLFSGETSLGAIIAESSAGVVVALLIAKALGYAISLAAGFRGGPTFPAVTLGVLVGVLGALVLPGMDLTPAVAAGLAAGAAAALRLPIFGALLTALMMGSGASQTVPIAVVGSVVGWLAAETVNARASRR
jgi:chloride channel protein, CIC family